MVDYLLGVAVLIAVYAISAVSLNLQVGVTGLLNFGQVAFVGIGAYSVAILNSHGVSWPVGFAVGAVLAAAAGAAVGRLGRTLASDYWAIATLALAELIRLVALNQDNLTGGAQGISNVAGVWTSLHGRTQALASLATIGAVLAMSVLVARRLTSVQFGRVLRTIRENQDLAAALGHNVVGAKARVMAVSAVLASVAGGFYAMYLAYIGPDQLLPLETFLIFTMVVAGGLGNVYGAVAGAALISLLYNASQFLPHVIALDADQIAGIRILLVGASLLAFLLARPCGLIPERPRFFHARR